MPTWNMSGQCPPLPGKSACFLIIVSKEEMKGWRGFAAHRAPADLEGRARLSHDAFLLAEPAPWSPPGWAA